MKKYVFKSYHELFPQLFLQEKQRILKDFSLSAEMEHIGSSAVPNLGGKGIIDIGIGASKEDFSNISQHLQNLGYAFKPEFSTEERWFFKIYLPDPIEEIRTYHVHLANKEGQEWKNLIKFRDYLREHPEAAKEYEEIKKQAVKQADGDGSIYRDVKKPLFRRILEEE